MRRICRLVFFIFMVFVGIASVVYIANYFIISTIDDVAKSTIVASAITLFGVIFSILYKEISTYYQDKSANINRKWDLIFPFIKEHYNPWINSANSLLTSLDDLNLNTLSNEAVARVLFLTTVFYGYRLRFIIKDGGLILLSSDEEEKVVEYAYRQIEKNFDWAKDETPRRVSYLQNLFLIKSKPDDPYVLSKFMEDLEKDKYIKESREIFRLWLTKDNIENLKMKIGNFISCFKDSIDKLYTAWGD